MAWRRVRLDGGFIYWFHQSHLMLPDVSWVRLRVPDQPNKSRTIRRVRVVDVAVNREMDRREIANCAYNYPVKRLFHRGWRSKYANVDIQTNVALRPR